MPIFETLEGREMFSGTMSTESVLMLNAAHAAPAALIAAKNVKAPKVQAIVSQSGTGLTGEYFQDANFQTGYMVRTDPTVKLAPTKHDSATIQSNGVRWTGQISPTYSESYSFSVIAKGGVRLWINGTLMIDQANAAGGNFRSSIKIDLIAGQKYAIKIEYSRKAAAGTSVQLLWSSLHQKQGLIPQKAMFPDTTVSLPATSAGLIGQYYSGKNFDKLVMQRIDPAINFNYGTTSPSILIPNGSSFSVRWTGQITPTYSETYTFKTTTDDGVRLYVDGQLLINDFVDHSAKSDTASISLVAGTAYDIRMDYYQDKHVATAQLRWSSQSTPLEVIPSSVLSSTPIATAGTLISSVIDSDSIDLHWTGSAAATGYLVEQSTDGGNTFTTIATTLATVREYEVDGLNPATQYTFRIAPLGSGYSSTPSNTLITGTATNSPANVSASPASSSSADVSWDDVPGENGFVIYGAQIANTQTQSLHTRSLFTADDTNLNFQPLGTVGAGVTSFLVTGLDPGSQYQFIVRSLNTAGTLSDLSNVATATTPSSAPSTLTNVPTTNSITINWVDVPGETGFAVDRSLTGIDGWNQIGTTDEGVTTYTDNTVQAGTAYFYRVRSLNAGGSSDPSALIPVVTAVNAPTNLASTAISATTTLLNWTDVAGEAGFVVLESADGGHTFSQIGITPAGITSFPVTGLTAGTPYQFEVEAINAAALPSVVSNVTSLVTTTASPASLIATAVSTSQANLTWNDVPGETGFTLERSPDGVSGWATIATLPTSTLSYADTTLSAGTTYFYRVRGTNSGGASAPSIAAAALTIPAAPVASLTGLSTSQSQVSWNAVSGAAHYVVQRSNTASSGWTTASTVTGQSLSTTVANLTASTLYYYRVQAVNATGASAQSTTVSQTSAPLAQYALHSAVYGLTASGGIYAVDLVNGTSLTIGQLPVIPTAPARDPGTGLLYFYQQGTSNIYSWDPTTGNTSLLIEDFISSPIVRGAYRADGTGFVISQDNMLRTITPGFPVVTVIGPVTLAGVALPTTSGTMDFSSTGQLFMLIGANLYTVNTTTAAATLIGTTTLVGNPTMVFGPKGILYMTTNSGTLLSTNPTTALATLIGNNNLPSFTGLAAVPTFTHLTISAAATPTVLAKGQNAIYAIQVNNTTGDASTQPITVITTLPTGLTFGSITGTGWTASVSGQVVTLTYAAGVAVNGTLPVVNLTVAVSSSAPSVVTTMFTAISGDLDGNATSTPATVISVAT